MSDCGRHGHPRPQRQKSCPETFSTNRDRVVVKGTGKRFARRAKRWAELQNRRSGKICYYPDIYDGFDMSFSETNSSPICERRYSIFQPTGHDAPFHYTSSKNGRQIYMTHGVNEFGQRTRISVYTSPPELTLFPAHPNSDNRIKTFSHHRSDSASPSPMCELSLLTRDLSVASISSNSSPSSSHDDDFILRSRHCSADYHVNTAPPPDRNWVMIRHADPDRPIATFTVLCYNVLCDKYATVNQYSYCPSWALNWEYRKMNIMKEIRSYEADIITLQEVETEQFNLLFRPELKALGYEGIFSPKSRAKTMNEEDRKYVDGCAIFWKSEKFEMDREQLIEFTSLVMKKASSSEHMLNRVMPRDNIALCAVLKIKEHVYLNRGRSGMAAADNVVGSPLVVCTGHIHWDPEFCDVKLVQTMMLANELTKLLEEVSEQYHISPQQTPVLICGDFNSLPDSGVFEFLSRGRISRTHTDLKGFRDDNSLDKFSSSSDPGTLMHSLRLESAVDTSTISFTNYTLDFKGMIDYIFSTPQSLARLGVLGPFEHSWVLQNKILGFPHPHVPSDHIPIMAQYAIIPPSHQRGHPPQKQQPQQQQQQQQQQQAHHPQMFPNFR